MILLLHVKQNKTKLSKKCHPYNTIIGIDCISYERQFEWWDEQNRCTYDDVKTTGAWYSMWMLQQVTAEVPPRLAARVNSAVSVDRTCMVNITFSHHFFCSWYMTKHISHTCGRSCDCQSNQATKIRRDHSFRWTQPRWSSTTTIHACIRLHGYTTAEMMQPPSDTVPTLSRCCCLYACCMKFQGWLWLIWRKNTWTKIKKYRCKIRRDHIRT